MTTSRVENPTERAYEERFFVQAPVKTNAQEAATRVYNRGGLLVRSDPFVGAADRHGKQFTQTKWHDPQDMTQPVQQARTRAPPVSESRDPVVRFRNKVIKRAGAAGIHALGKTFVILDHNHSGSLSADELRVGCEHFGLDMDDAEIKDLVDVIGRGRNITYDEFLVAIRGPLSKKRITMIEMAYKVLDRDGNGHVTADDLRERFSGDHDPDVMAGKKPAEEALHDFLANFDIDHDGDVTKKDFIEYYKNVSASIDRDDYFELMIRNAWHIPGGTGWSANTANTRVLVVTHDGTQKVVCIQNDLGLDMTDGAAVMKALHDQGETDVVKWSLNMNL